MGMIRHLLQMAVALLMSIGIWTLIGKYGRR